jgi:hypothetical protein
MIRIAQNSTNIPNQQLSEMIEYVVSQLQVPRNFDVMLKNSSSKANSSGTFYQGGTFQRY